MIKSILFSFLALKNLSKFQSTAFLFAKLNFELFEYFTFISGKRQSQSTWTFIRNVHNFDSYPDTSTKLFLTEESYSHGGLQTKSTKLKIEKKIKAQSKEETMDSSFEAEPRHFQLTISWYVILETLFVIFLCWTFFARDHIT